MATDDRPAIDQTDSPESANLGLPQGTVQSERVLPGAPIDSSPESSAGVAPPRARVAEQACDAARLDSSQSRERERADTTRGGEPSASSGQRILRDACLVVGAAAALGVLSNLIRTNERLDWIQKKPYDILVPCPEPVGEAQVTEPQSPLVSDASSLLIDARSATEFGAWHWAGAINVPFDWLGPPVHDDVVRVAESAARSKARRVIVYGDGDDPDSGREWARLLSGGGIKNVSFVRGGAPALKQRAQAQGGKVP